MTVAPEVTPPADAAPASRSPHTPHTTYVAGELVGGPLGRHARRGVRWSLLSALVLTTVITCLVGYGQKFPCRDVSNWQHNYQYTRVCYSDILPLYSTEKLNENKLPYVDQPVEYPVLIGAAMEAGAVVSHAAPKDNFTARNAVFFDATAILLTLAAIITVICTALTAGRRRLDVMLLAAAPLLAFHAFTNWDLLAVAFAAGGLLAWSKKAPAVAGILFGFGAATKAYPLLILVALGLLAYRAGRLGAWRRCTLWAVGTLVVTYAAVWPFAGSYVDDAGHRHNNLYRFFELNSSRTADWDSLPYVAQYLGRTESTATVAWVSIIVGVLIAGVVGNWRRSSKAAVITLGAMAILTVGVTQTVSYARSRGAIPHSVLNAAGAVWGIFLVAVIGYIVLTAPRRPRVPQIAFLVIVAFLLSNKVDSPQYSLWLLPLAVLAYPHWRVLLGWQIVEIYEVVMRYLWFVYDDSTAFGKAGVPEGWFVSAVVARQVAVLVVAALIVSDIYQPERDVVRQAANVDDPAGGILDGVPDRRVFA
ncbi:MAG TPA: glycosyltransferase 87 family protein [Frankiaceae bacterium]|jgi:uncharacterized membrane protein|nr:glycosyltransferase 87 family protein [Frankiaceae bacterium]